MENFYVIQTQRNQTKVKAGYKTIYIKDELSEKLNLLAEKHNTSFNNIVISIIEDFFEREDN